MHRFLIRTFLILAPLGLVAQESEDPSEPESREKPLRVRRFPDPPSEKAGEDRAAPQGQPDPTRPTGSRETVPRNLEVNPEWRRVEKPVPADPLPEDLILRYTGSFQGEFDLDLKLPAGRGPEFRITEKMTGQGPDEEHPPQLRIITTISEAKGGYLVAYSIRARVTLVTPARPPRFSRGVEFRDVKIEGAVLVKPGEPVRISKINGKELSLRVSKAGGEPAGGDGPDR